MRAAAVFLALASAALADVPPYIPVSNEPGGLGAGLLFAGAVGAAYWATRPSKPGTMPRAVRGGLAFALAVAGVGSYLWGLETARQKRRAADASRMQYMNERLRQHEEEMRRRASPAPR